MLIAPPIPAALVRREAGSNSLFEAVSNTFSLSMICAIDYDIMKNTGSSPIPLSIADDMIACFFNRDKANLFMFG